jgi:tetratricopeptide (TPR) repeat protein
LRQLPAQVDPKNPEQSSILHLLEGEVALARGSHRRAVELLLLAEREASTPETLASLAYAHDKAGETEQAIGCYEKLIAMGRRALGWEPQQSWIAAHARLAEIRLSRGKRSQAALLLSTIERLWKDADPDLPLVKNIARLRTQLQSAEQ